MDTANAFVLGAYEKFSTCLTTFGAVSEVIELASDTGQASVAYAAEAMQSFPAQVINGLQLAVGLALCFYGFKLVRPANFFAGAFLGSSASLILLTIFAPSLTMCLPLVSITLGAGLLVGALCALSRTSMMIVLGLVVGEICGDLFYKAVLAGVGLPAYMAYASIGFFAVLLAAAFGYLGDFSWKLGSSFLGAPHDPLPPN